MKTTFHFTADEIKQALRGVLLARMRGSFASEGFENIINKASVVIRIEEIERGDQREPYKVTECVGADIVVELP